MCLRGNSNFEPLHEDEPTNVDSAERGCRSGNPQASTRGIIVAPLGAGADVNDGPNYNEQQERDCRQFQISTFRRNNIL
jgi:hypothetical protein